MKTRKKQHADLIKAMNIRMPREMWYFLKRTSLDDEMSINQIITTLITKYKEKREGSGR